MSDLPTIRILQLYPRDMNIYGDWGNVLTLKRRLEWHGYGVEITDYNVGDTFPTEIDMIVGGGGQDSGQARIHQDLLSISGTLKDLAVDNVPMLMVCGLYQLFGHEFRMNDGSTLSGIGILDVTTDASTKRMIGNIVTSSPEFGELVGYENHSGQTVLGETAEAFATVIKGDGNNSRDRTEGARYRNVIGTYLHGSLLPKNPQVADWLIARAAERAFGVFHPKQLDDTIVKKARNVAMNRPR